VRFVHFPHLTLGCNFASANYFSDVHEYPPEGGDHRGAAGGWYVPQSYRMLQLNLVCTCFLGILGADGQPSTEKMKWKTIPQGAAT
jgi:hypothetical protein